jgi:hypothetical protein
MVVIAAIRIEQKIDFLVNPYTFVSLVKKKA